MIHTEGCGLQDVKSANLDQSHPEWLKRTVCPLLGVILYRLLHFNGGTLAVHCLEYKSVCSQNYVLFLLEQQLGVWNLSIVERLSTSWRACY